MDGGAAGRPQRAPADLGAARRPPAARSRRGSALGRAREGLQRHDRLAAHRDPPLRDPLRAPALRALAPAQARLARRRHVNAPRARMLAALVAWGAGACAHSPKEVPSGGDTAAMVADRVFVNGSIHTLDPRQPILQALAVKDGNIVYLG